MTFRNKITENIFSMVSLKGLEYILNFALIPFLLRTLGAEKYGAIVFVQGIVQYFVVLVDYGFNMTGPRDIAKSENKKEIGSIFSNIFVAKILILILGYGVFHVVLNLMKWKSYIDMDLFNVVFLLVIGNVLFPVWFFQGIQQMRYITIINFIAKLIIVLLVFAFIREPADYVYAALFQSSTLVVAGVISIVVILRNYKYVFVKPDIMTVIKTLKSGWHIFVSTIAINLYTTTNIVFLGMLLGNEAVGCFSAANKLIDSVKGVMNAITQALYPHFSKLIMENKYGIKYFLNKTMKLYCGFFVFVSVVLVVFAPLIIWILFGDKYMEVVPLLRILALLPAIISVSNIYGIQVMLNYGYQQAFSRILVLAAIINLAIIVPVINMLNEYGVAITMMITEIMVTIGTYCFYRSFIKAKLY